MEKYSIQKRSNGTFQLVFRVAGKRVYRSLGTNNRREAERRARVVMESPKVAPCTVAMLAERIEEHARAHLTEGTAKRYHSVFLNFIEFIGANALIQDVTLLSIDAYEAHRLKSVKPVTVNLEIRHLAAAFTRAVKWQLIAGNPFVQCSRLQERKKPIQTFTPEQLSDVLAVLPSTLAEMARFAFYSGCRLAEVCSMKWENVNLETGIVTIACNESFRTKSGKNRRIPMHPEMSAMLKRLLIPAKHQSNEYVFVSSQGQPFSPGYVGHKFSDACHKCGLKLTFHNLRKSFASLLLSMDAPIAVISSLLGHAEIRTTQQHYAECLPERRGDIVNLLPSLHPTRIETPASEMPIFGIESFSMN